MNLVNGQYAVGIMQGFITTPWKNDPQRFNNEIVLYREYEDRYGNISRDYTNIKVGNDDIPRARELGNKLKGKRCIVACVNNVKSGISKDKKPYAFLDTYLPRDGNITELPQGSKAHA